MSDWKQRLTDSLEPVLREPDPRPKLSAYHDMPYAIFQYPPEAEFELRHEVALLGTRLEHAGKRVTRISLAERLAEALGTEGLTAERLAQAEASVGLQKTIETVHEVISSYRPLDDLVAKRMPDDPDPLRDVILILRAGALFPFYRTSALLDHLQGKITVPGVLFYPGELEGPAGLRFMGVLDPEHSYRPRIF